MISRPPKAQPPRKRSGQRTVWQSKRWKAGRLGEMAPPTE